MRTIKLTTASLLLVFSIVSCGVLDLMPKPDTTEEAIGFALVSITSARVAVREQLETARITADQAQAMQDVLNKARDICDVAAFTMTKGDEESALRYLDMALDVLARVEEMIDGRS